jgi:hypothetical protein
LDSQNTYFNFKIDSFIRSVFFRKLVLAQEMDKVLKKTNGIKSDNGQIYPNMVLPCFASKGAVGPALAPHPFFA